MNDYRTIHDDYIMHFGILGQKWGIRRYQNQDGSLTPAGKARYLKPDGSLNKEGLKRARFDKFGDDRDTLSKELQRLNWNKDHPKNQQWQEISAWDPKALERKRESSKMGGNITGKQVSDLMKKKGVTYEDIYLEMADDGLLNMESEDNDDFKKAEYEWYKKHSKEIKHSIGEDINMPWTNDQMYAMINKPEPEEITRYDLINKPDPDELKHYGVIGMKWGIRRYQNKDGSYTKEGLRRLEKQEKKEAKDHDKAYKKAIKNPEKLDKYYDKLTDDEVKEVKKKYNDIMDVKNRQAQVAKSEIEAYSSKLKMKEAKRKVGILGTAAFTAGSIGTIAAFLKSDNGQEAIDFVKRNANILKQRLDPNFIGPKQLLPGEQFVKMMLKTRLNIR